ncbi:MAG: 1,4-dihydroxy-6-naphthoate synthase [Bacteroidales bacterium]|nr:1,4-dihydroxy-6-naphthoate synthase [Bacteroidales bacterium]MDD2424560.1 1,4-dihydroxy-6-naphthoate synthase [Bacteroidales bacterium]MDD3988766.1 1,4-dihydroxy-6-naphthoate synthase [Bacteroidales bacterium]MDD4638879.1 1,4-dihydroxy-6-naphthoate synthase [Bacteroidales bacterium]
MIIKLAYSPCPNDTFAFHAMVHNLVDTEGIEFKTELADVELLNQRAQDGIYDMCKLSYHAYFHLCDKYVMLKAGSALGYNNGPLLVARESFTGLTPDSKIAIPGRMTTAALLLSIAYPQLQKREPVLFSQIASRVLSGEFDAGVLIHEGRFTYEKDGLKLICDLGNFWHTHSGTAVPLGGIAVSRNFNKEIRKKINRILKKSIEFAFTHPDISDEYVTLNAQIADREIQKKHINLYVNKFSLDIGSEGKKAVYSLYKNALKSNQKIKVVRVEELFI